MVLHEEPWRPLTVDRSRFPTVTYTFFHVYPRFLTCRIQKYSRKCPHKPPLSLNRHFLLNFSRSGEIELVGNSATFSRSGEISPERENSPDWEKFAYIPSCMGSGNETCQRGWKSMGTRRKVRLHLFRALTINSKYFNFISSYFL